MILYKSYFFSLLFLPDYVVGRIDQLHRLDGHQKEVVKEGHNLKPCFSRAKKSATPININRSIGKFLDLHANFVC